MNPAEYEAMYRLEGGLWWYTGMRRLTAAALGPALGRRRPDGTRPRILDAGCGTGGNLAWLASAGPAWGIDLSPLATAYCRRRGLETVAQASVLRLPFADATFDLVTGFDVIYHLGVADDVAALAEMRRVLRPGGTLFVRVPAIEALRSAHDEAVHTRQRYSAGELRAKSERAGLTVERAGYVNALLLPLAAVSRLARRRRSNEKNEEVIEGDGAEASDVRPVPGPLNALFGAALGLEARLLRYVDLPIGLSAFVVARRAD